MLKQQIAESLEQAFSEWGFAEPSVSQLKTACNVSLRTLYKHYPSKTDMIVAALSCRHQRYIARLEAVEPAVGVTAVSHSFEQLGVWMQDFAPHGCMSLHAIAAFPDNSEIAEAVAQHKHQVRELLARQSQREDLAASLFLLHEGISSAWPVIGGEAVVAAQQMLVQLFTDD